MSFVFALLLILSLHQGTFAQEDCPVCNRNCPHVPTRLENGGCRLTAFIPEFSTYTTADEIVKFIKFAHEVACRIYGFYSDTWFTIVSYGNKPNQNLSDYYQYDEFLTVSKKILDDYLKKPTQGSTIYLEPVLEMINNFSDNINHVYTACTNVQLVFFGQDDKIRDPTAATTLAKKMMNGTACAGRSQFFIIDRSTQNFSGSVFDILIKNDTVLRLQGEITRDKLRQLAYAMIFGALEAGCYPIAPGYISYATCMNFVSAGCPGPFLLSLDQKP
uniref:VWFA domain-containing protein n=1 Tax=Panagrolaimus sp. JU765 TaxID=591449 RepID=A0AC34QI68_9BILA